jgi:GT2 family glycosyltransferase
VLFLNNDTLVLEPLDALVAVADRLGSRCGALGGRVLNADKTIQYTCRLPYTLPVLISSLTLTFAGIRPWFVRRQELRDWDHAAERDVAMVSGCYMLVPRAVLDHVGVFDPTIFLYYEETDLCYRISDAGYGVRYAPVSTIIHLGGGSTRSRGLSERGLNRAVWGARYFARNHLGRGKAQLLAVAVWFCWALVWLIFALLGLVAPRQRRRAAFRHRARLLRHMLAAMPRQHFPAQPPFGYLRR